MKSVAVDDPYANYFTHSCFIDIHALPNINYLTGFSTMLKTMPALKPYSGVVSHRLDLITFVNSNHYGDIDHAIDFEIEDDFLTYAKAGDVLYRDYKSVRLSPHWGVKFNISMTDNYRYRDIANIRLHVLQLEMQLFTYVNYNMFKGLSVSRGKFMLPTFKY